MKNFFGSKSTSEFTSGSTSNPSTTRTEDDKNKQSTVTKNNNIIEVNIPTVDNVESYFDTTVLTFFSQGQKKGGVEDGPYFLCKLVNDTFNIKTNAIVRPVHTTVEDGNDWQQDYKNLYEYLCTKNRYLLLGGDHSCGQSSVAASIEKVPDPNNLYVIWIDAHPDCNTMQASLTKNIHGQPLAGILGFEEPWFPIKTKLSTTNLLYFGIRDIDDFEKQMIAENNIFYTSDLTAMLTKITSIKESNPLSRFHVSFDVDALDPVFMDATGCVVPDGISPNDVSEIVKSVLHSLIAFDIVEFNPSLGNKDVGLSSVKEIIEKIAERLKST